MKTIDNNHSDNWGIKRMKNGKFILIDTISGGVLHNAQGYGFTTYYKAYYFGFNTYRTHGKCNGTPNVDEYEPLF